MLINLKFLIFIVERWCRSNYSLTYDELSYFCHMSYDELNERISSLSNDELLKLLKRRTQYESEAVDIAVREAKKRELIQSDDDLNTPDFQLEQTGVRSIFPYMENNQQFRKIFSSLIRLLYLFAILPLLFGVLKLIESQLVFGSMLIISGLLWLGLSVLLQKQKRSQIPLFLIVLFIVMLGGLLYFKLSLKSIGLPDLLILAVGVLVVLYVLTYLRVLLVRREGAVFISE